MMTILQAGMSYSDGERAAAAGMGVIGIFITLLIGFFYGYCCYRLYKKAGADNAWMGFVPILNYLPMLQIARKPTWWIILLLIPLLNIIIAVILWMRIAKAFGKNEILFGIGMLFLGFILLPVLALDGSQYNPNALPDETGNAL